MLARVTRSVRSALSVVLLVVAGAGAYLLGTSLRPGPEPAGTALQEPVAVSGLTLVDQRGAAFDLAGDLEGDVALVFFGFTRCPDVCPLTRAQLSSAYGAVARPQDSQELLGTDHPT